MQDMISKNDMNSMPIRYVLILELSDPLGICLYPCYKTIPCHCSHHHYKKSECLLSTAFVCAKCVACNVSFIPPRGPFYRRGP